MTGRIVPFRIPGRAGALPARAEAPRRPPEPPLAQPPDAARFADVVLPHLPSAYVLARYLTRNAAAAEDVVQEAALRAFRGFAGFRGGDAKAWLMAIVRSAYIDTGRRERTWRETVTGPAAEDALASLADPDQESAETGLIRQGDTAAVRAAIEALPQPFRETLVLRELEGLSYRDIAAATDVAMGTVMSRLARARELLAKRLGLAPEDAR